MITTRRSLLVAIPLAVAFALGVAVTPARADMSKKVIAAFKGKIVISNGPLENQGDDKATIAKIKQDHLTEVKGQVGNDDVTQWYFVYTAFLTKAGSPTLKFEFYDGDRYAADQRLTNVDPKMTVLNGEITITEDDGITKGKKYTVKLVGTVRGKEATLATTTLVMK